MSMLYQSTYLMKFSEGNTVVNAHVPTILQCKWGYDSKNLAIEQNYFGIILVIGQCLLSGEKIKGS